jgi:hypothetical protein
LGFKLIPLTLYFFTSSPPLNFIAPAQLHQLAFYFSMSPKHSTTNSNPSSDEETCLATRPESSNVPDTTSDDIPIFSFMTGIKSDLKARIPLYGDDWKRPNVTVLNATIFAFVIQLIPALIFAELMTTQTEGNLSIAETLLSSGIMGVIYAIFSGQPLVIMGITGPVAILLGTSYGLAAKFGAPYFGFFFWICVWSGLLHILSSLLGLVQLVWKVTPFTSQVFELFIAITFIYTSLKELIEPIGLGVSYTENRESSYATLVLGVITCYIAWSLHFAETWIYGTHALRVFLTSYNTALACIIVTALSFLPGFDLDSKLERVSIEFAPWDWQPTADRPWVVNPLQGMTARGILGALIPGIMFFLLFIIDHNVSSILTQSPKFNLKKPPAYHWDFLVLGVTFFPCAILGLPPGNGLIPQAPLHCRALCTRKYVTDEFGLKREIFTDCQEQRWSGLGQALLMFVALACFTVLSWIPRGVLFGLFLYLGMGALHGNEIWERLVLCVVAPSMRPGIPVVSKVSKWRQTQLYTFIQLACAMTVFAVAQFADFGYIYPALLTALVPLRSYVVSRWFSQDDLQHLDPVTETEEEYHEEQREFHHAHGEEEFRGIQPDRRRRHTLGHADDIVPDADEVVSRSLHHPTMLIVDATHRMEGTIQKHSESGGVRGNSVED